MFRQIAQSRSRQVALAIGAAALASTAVTGAAEAKHYKRFQLSIHVESPYYSAHFHRPGWRWRRCRWLRRRAMWTGSRYWWRRYRWCMRGY